MNPAIEPAAAFGAVTRPLARTEGDAAANLLLLACRCSPGLTDWLLGDFAESEQTRAAFRRRIRTAAADSPHLLNELTGTGAVLNQARVAAGRALAGRLNAPRFGGLSRQELDRLIRRYQSAGSVPVAFLLLEAWRRHRLGPAIASPRLLLASAAFFEAALANENGELFRQLLKAQALLAGRRAVPLERSVYGYSNWWKLSLLLYVRNHPKPQYRTGELRSHLAAQRLTVDAKDIRAFCKKHGLARDTRAGRPRRL